MPYLSEFERKAWENREKSNDHKPEVALKAALDDLAEHEPGMVQHVVVAMATKKDDKRFIVEYYSAGSFNAFAAQGLIGDVMGKMQRGD